MRGRSGPTRRRPLLGVVLEGLVAADDDLVLKRGDATVAAALADRVCTAVAGVVLEGLVAAEDDLVLKCDDAAVVATKTDRGRAALVGIGLPAARDGDRAERGDDQRP